MFSSKIAQRLGKYFANWVSQHKKCSIDKMRQYKMIPIFHACGDHSLCNGVEDTFCLAVKEKEQNKPYHRKPIFDLKKKAPIKMG